MSDLLFQPARRSAMKPLIGLFGKSGGGKTLSALLLARGLVGPKGKIGLVDTEQNRGAVYTDMVPGSYLHLNFQPPFNPLRYCEIMDEAEKQGIECLVVDSATHEWTGAGGYLDLKEEALQRMAGEDWKKREKCAMAAAAQVKPKTHSRFVAQVLRCKMSVIMCFRAHEKVRMDKSEGGMTIKVDETPSPIQDGELIYEMMIAGECYSQNGIGGYFRITGPHCKHTHPSILKLLPKDGEQLGITHGEQLAAWCAAAASGAPVTLSSAAAHAGPSPAPTDPNADTPERRRELKAQLWKVLLPVRGPGSKWETSEKWMREQKIMTADEYLGDATVEQLGWMISEATAKLDEVGNVP